MIRDSHVHIWRNWPYEPPVPDPLTRGGADLLLHEMDANGVEKAVVICAAIGDNPRNTDDAFAAAERHPGRFIVFPDIDCRWSPEHRTPGAAARLEQALTRWSFHGFNHYLGEAEDGSWLLSDEGRAFFGVAAKRGLLVSLSVVPHQIESVIALAVLFPTLRILLHHFAFVGPRTAGTPDALERVIAAARCPNIILKYSGAGNVAGPEMEYPYAELQPALHRLALAFGPERVVWGSDHPVSRRHMTYRQTLSHLTRHGPFEGAALNAVLGGTLETLLAGR